MTLIEKSQTALDKFADFLDEPKTNNELMNELLAPVFDFAKQDSSLEKKLKSYHTLFNRLPIGEYQVRFERMCFCAYIHGFDTCYKSGLARILAINVGEIEGGFNMSPEEAVKYFTKLGIKISDNWQDTAKAIKSYAFSVSKLMRIDILTDLKSILEDAIKNGMSSYTFRKEVYSLLEKYGWLGKADPNKPKDLESPARLNIIYRTNLQNSYQHGHWEQANEVIDLRPYIQMLSVMDSKTTKSCHFLNLKVFKIRDRLINEILPPGHFQCRRTIRTLSERQFKQLGGLLYNAAEVPEAYRNMKGFKKVPLGTWTPDLTGYPPEIVKLYKM